MSIDPMEKFATRIEARAKNLSTRIDGLVIECFALISTQIFIHNPIWSSQSVVNWTASIGKSPTIRRVNVDRSNVGITNNRVTNSGGEGDKSNITAHPEFARSAGLIAGQMAFVVSQGYTKSVSGTNDSIWLSNSISYTPKLWSGAWPTNPMTLADAVEFAIPAIRRFKMLKVR